MTKRISISSASSLPLLKHGWRNVFFQPALLTDPKPSLNKTITLYAKTSVDEKMKQISKKKKKNDEHY